TLSTVNFNCCFRLRKRPKNSPALLLNRGAHSTLNRHLVNCFFEESLKRFLQNFQAVTASLLTVFSGQPLKRDAHSTEPS
ncbi:hypothetical protein, partial [Marinobacter sp.]|uniref:hypothetical protein n=1 Tax=Marinobacter sp. TaxID=50741 RepID=UPI002B2705F2